MKPILAFLAAFVVATSASTGAKVMLTKPAPASKKAADSTKTADSTATEAEASHALKADGDSAHASATTANASTSASASAAKQSPAATLAKVPGFGASSTLVNTGIPAAKPQAATVPEPAPATSDSVAEASERRLAKVFTAMEPKQAAKVLEHMQNGDVQIILGYVGPRQAASIMAELPPERVAALSKAAMQGKTK